MDGSTSHQHNINVPINDQGTPIDHPGNVLPDRPPSDQQSEGTYDSPEELSPPMNIPTYVQTLMNCELPLCGPFETDDQYDQWYQSQLCRISNTHRSWVRGAGYNPLPHLPTSIPQQTNDSNTRRDRKWNNIHPDCLDCPLSTQDEVKCEPPSRVERNHREPQVQFESASRMYHYDNNNGTSPSGNQSYGGPLGLSAFRVSRAPLNNGL
jgi:hypothetical protein